MLYSTQKNTIGKTTRDAFKSTGADLQLHATSEHNGKRDPRETVVGE